MKGARTSFINGPKRDSWTRSLSTRLYSEPNPNFVFSLLILTTFATKKSTLFIIVMSSERLFEL